MFIRLATNLLSRHVVQSKIGLLNSGLCDLFKSYLLPTTYLPTYLLPTTYLCVDKDVFFCSRAIKLDRTEARRYLDEKNVKLTHDLSRQAGELRGEMAEKTFKVD